MIFIDGHNLAMAGVIASKACKTRNDYRRKVCINGAWISTSDLDGNDRMIIRRPDEMSSRPDEMSSSWYDAKHRAVMDAVHQLEKALGNLLQDE